MNFKDFMLRIIIITALYFTFIATKAHACPDVDGLLDVNCDGKVKIVAFGDSITFGVRDSTGLGYPGRLVMFHAPNVELINAGLPGENTDQGRLRAPLIAAQNTDADFFISLEGINDYWLSNKSQSRTKSNLISIRDNGSTLGGYSFVNFLTATRRDVQRSWVSSVNSTIAQFAVINFYALGESIISFDLLHPNDLGYQQMADLVINHLRTWSILNRPIDTDGDGVYDFAEIRYGTNIFSTDSDADGLLDGEELFTYHSNPLVIDSDGDGLNDYYEAIVLMSNPADPRPTPPTIQTIEIIP